MEALLGLILVTGTLLLLRRLADRPDRPQPAFIKTAGTASGVAVAFTAALALGAGLIIHGGMAVWRDAPALWTALP